MERHDLQADPYRALPALAGHPDLLRASDRVPISLACKPVELVDEQERNGYSLALSRWMPRGEMQCVEAAPRSIFSIIFRDVWKAPPICLESMG